MRSVNGSQPPAEPGTPTTTPSTSTSPLSIVSFTRSVQVFLSEDQHRFLTLEVKKRRDRGKTSDVPAAKGANRNVNMGMLIREALEKQFQITPHEREAA